MEGDMVVRKYEGYSGRMICGTLLERWGWGMMGGGYAGRTTSPKSARPGCRFWTSPPQSTKNGKQERRTICKPKKECLFCI